MGESEFYQTRTGRQYYEVTLPELVRQLTRLNDLLALGVELIEKRSTRISGSCHRGSPAKPAP